VRTRALGQACSTRTTRITRTRTCAAIVAGIAASLLAACATADLSYPPVQPPEEGGTFCPGATDDSGACTVDSGIRIDAASDAANEAASDAASDAAQDAARDAATEASTDAGAG
jgi:hypothetical protein